MNEQAACVAPLVSDEDLPPILEWHAHYARPESLDCVRLCRGRMIWHDDATRYTERTGTPGDALRHVPRACRPDTLAQCIAIGEQHGVARAAQLEGADWLQVLELEIQLATGDLEPNERCADHVRCDALVRPADFVQRDRVGQLLLHAGRNGLSARRHASRRWRCAALPLRKWRACRDTRRRRRLLPPGLTT